MKRQKNEKEKKKINKPKQNYQSLQSFDQYNKLNTEMSDPLADYTNLSHDEIDPSTANVAESQQPEPEQQVSEHQEPQQQELTYENDENVLSSIKVEKVTNGEEMGDIVRKKLIRNSRPQEHEQDDFNDNSNVTSGSRPSLSQQQTDEIDIANMDPQQRKRFELEERMSAAIKSTNKRRRKADEDDLERMQDDKIDYLKDQMIKAANSDVEKNSQGQIATEKLKLLREVTDILARADLAIPILDNNLLEAVRLWLEPLPDASMPAYQIQKELIHALETLPIKTDHLVASGIGKVLVFYQRSKRTEPSLKKIVDRLIGDWTRPILNKSDSYKDRTVQFHEYNRNKFTNKLSRGVKRKEAKTLYEENAERRKRAAIPSTRTTAYKIAPQVDKSLLMRQQARHASNDERFKRINSKLTSMSVKRKAAKKGGPSIEGRDLAM
ncbi:chromatin-associated transcriptional (elongation) factor, putative [Candida dubliniensis CD36]|uniref:Transcription factor IWS1 n=1 Tax=Candida dubliniensis (strain CD36 / ATCC MYA-646 / CBS 7987 / NCPF 3949 / NRRL Y-17841) TaxID=573826 RepID=B9W858_CANDC|nr:chromatin-associated transcriptional (elongation) factor, putative [Candida dubliniensis CD36]CAX44899.1 chromatin-associated transcriptional (elongation) factor, putative [Candida dubliniensis CD36]